MPVMIVSGVSAMLKNENDDKRKYLLYRASITRGAWTGDGFAGLP